jgi:hypothetical protein
MFAVSCYRHYMLHCKWVTNAAELLTMFPPFWLSWSWRSKPCELTKWQEDPEFGQADWLLHRQGLANLENLLVFCFFLLQLQTSVGCGRYYRDLYKSWNLNQGLHGCLNGPGADRGLTKFAWGLSYKRLPKNLGQIDRRNSIWYPWLSLSNFVSVLQMQGEC